MTISKWNPRQKIGAVLAIVMCLIALIGLKANGTFNLIEQVPSPNGKILTRIYRGSEAHFYMDNSVCFSDSGAFQGSTIYENARYVGTWWSPNSRYRLEVIYQDGSKQMWLVDYKLNNCTNLVNALNQAAYSLTEFADAKDVEYDFQCWDEYDNVMKFTYSFRTDAGENMWGALFFDWDSHKIVAFE